MMTDLSTRPRTLAPPPLVYATGLGLSWWLEKIVPLGFVPSHDVQQITWGLVWLGFALMLWAVVTIWRHNTTVNPYKGVSSLVTTGPFAFSRNPIYLADVLVYLAVMVLMGTIWPLFFAPLVWVVMRYAVIAHEEAHLTAKFGDVYTVYCQRVRRWI
jgi:protein-S-isoprenylcysteine O-methyltransferase Ste14